MTHLDDCYHLPSPSNEKQQQVWKVGYVQNLNLALISKRTHCSTLAKNSFIYIDMYTVYHIDIHIKDIYIIYIYTNRLAEMIYTQRYKTTTCLVSKSQCLPFWHVFFVPRSKVASCPSNNTDALQGLQVDLPFLGQQGWSRNRNEVAEWNPSFVEENVRRNFPELGGTIQMQCEDVAQNESWAVHRLVCP